MEQNIATLQSAGIPRSTLYMAWDFTVASEESLSERALTIRDDALDRLNETTPGDGNLDGNAPPFTVETVQEPTLAENANVFRQIDGTLQDVPCYLDNNNCAPGGQFDFDNDGDVTWDPGDSIDVPFRCIIPRAAVAGGTVQPAKPGTYGHGLLGDRLQVNGQGRLANEDNSIWCAVDWAGFSVTDLAQVLMTLQDVSRFNRLVDRMQQGFVHFHYLGRALMHPNGFATNAAFQFDEDGPGGNPDESLIDPTELYFEGISQGAIMGGALTAMSPDFTQSVLNVNGMNYSTLLRRSVDSDEYFKLPNLGPLRQLPERARAAAAPLDDAAAVGPRRVQRLRAPHDDRPASEHAHPRGALAARRRRPPGLQRHRRGQARTAGIPIHQPALDPGRHWESNPFMDLTPIAFGPGPAFTPHTGSALVYYDGGPVSWFNDGSPAARGA